jgi:membrane protein
MRALSALPTSRPVRTLIALVHGLRRARSLGLAAELAFWLFLSLVPFAAVAGLVTARVATARSDLLEAALASTPAEVRDFVAHQVERVAAWHGATVGPIAAITFVWLASSGVHAILDALELQTCTMRPWWRKRIIAIGGCIAVSVGIALVGLAAAGLGWITRVAGTQVSSVVGALEASPAWRIVRVIVSSAVGVGALSGLYWVAVPPDQRRATPVLPGAITAVVLQELLGFGYGWYVGKVGAGDAYMAGLAIVGVTLFTLYLFALALLVGAELNGVLRDERARREERAAPPASPLAERLPGARA